jgi:hypothetical protein
MKAAAGIKYGIKLAWLYFKVVVHRKRGDRPGL